MNRSLITRNESPFLDFTKKFFGNDFEYYPSRLFESKALSNIIEEEDKYSIELSAPGFKKDDIKIEIDNDVLRISSDVEDENEEEKNGYYRREFYKSSFERNFALPKNINKNKISASMEDGILNIDIPKEKEKETKNLQISIK